MRPRARHVRGGGRSRAARRGADDVERGGSGRRHRQSGFASHCRGPIMIATSTPTTRQDEQRSRRLARPARFVAKNGRLVLAFVILAVLLVVYIERVPQFGAREQRSVVNQGMALTTAGFGQTVVVLTGG